MRIQQIEWPENAIAILYVADIATCKVMLNITSEDFIKYESDPTKVDYVTIGLNCICISSKSKCGELVPCFAYSNNIADYQNLSFHLK